MNVLDPPQEVAGPPEATLSRRAQSYSDFHDAVEAIRDQDVASKGAAKENLKENDEVGEGNITSELDFAGWYNGLEHELLDSSHDEYMSAIIRPIRESLC